MKQPLRDVQILREALEELFLLQVSSYEDDEFASLLNERYPGYGFTPELIKSFRENTPNHLDPKFVKYVSALGMAIHILPDIETRVDKTVRYRKEYVPKLRRERLLQRDYEILYDFQQADDRALWLVLRLPDADLAIYMNKAQTTQALDLFMEFITQQLEAHAEAKEKGRTDWLKE